MCPWIRVYIYTYLPYIYICIRSYINILYVYIYIYVHIWVVHRNLPPQTLQRSGGRCPFKKASRKKEAKGNWGWFDSTSASWWFQPLWKILVKMEIFPKVRAENKKYLEAPTSQFLVGVVWSSANRWENERFIWNHLFAPSLRCGRHLFQGFKC